MFENKYYLIGSAFWYDQNKIDNFQQLIGYILDEEEVTQY